MILHLKFSDKSCGPLFNKYAVNRSDPKNWGKLPSRFSGYRHGLLERHKLEEKIQKDSFERIWKEFF